jgi:hypothetical protein
MGVVRKLVSPITSKIAGAGLYRLAPATLVALMGYPAAKKLTNCPMPNSKSSRVTTDNRQPQAKSLPHPG